MNLSTRSRRSVVLVAVAFFAACAPCLDIASGADTPDHGKEQRILLAGGPDVLWVAHTGQGDKGDKFDLLIRRPGGKWRILSRFSGSPVALAAGPKRLHIVTGGSTPNTTVFWLSDDKAMTLRSMAPGEKWPLVGSPPTAMAPIPALGKSGVQGLIAIVPQESDRLSTPAATSQPAVKNSGFALFQTIDGKWEPLGRIDNVPGAVGAGVSISHAGGWVYIMVAAKDLPARLMAWNTAETTMAWKEIAPPDSPHAPLSLCTIKNRAVLVTTTPAAAIPPAPGDKTPPKAVEVKLYLHEIKADKIVSKPQSIRNMDQPLVLPVGAAPTFCSLGKPDESQLVLLWRQDKIHRCALADINGQIGENKVVKELQKDVSQFDARMILEYFLWATLPLILLLVMTGQRSSAPIAPTMPTQFILGAFPKRLAAILMDWVPITFLASTALMVSRPDLTPDELMEMLRAPDQQNIPPELFISLVGSFVVWVVYGSIMEIRFGATLGKMAMKLEVVSLSGKRPDYRQVILRNVIRPVELIVPPIIIISVALSFLTRTHQRLGDLLAKTVVVEKKPAAAPSQTLEDPNQDPPAEA